MRGASRHVCDDTDASITNPHTLQHGRVYLSLFLSLPLPLPVPLPHPQAIPTPVYLSVSVSAAAFVPVSLTISRVLSVHYYALHSPAAAVQTQRSRSGPTASAGTPAATPVHAHSVNTVTRVTATSTQHRASPTSDVSLTMSLK
jgi:hypothetical protein